MPETTTPAAAPAKPRGFTPTPEQGKAICARGNSLLVSAAAGSGKTRVLVERVVGILADRAHPVKADRMLIVTFTKAAASKLRADLSERLHEEIVRNLHSEPRDEAQIGWLRNQQMLLQRAGIGTMDAFCLQFVRQNFAFYSRPLAPDISVADQTTIGNLRQQALAATLEQVYREDTGFAQFADLYGRGRSDEEAAAAILKLYDFTCSLPHPKQMLRSYLQEWKGTEPFVQTGWGRLIVDSTQRQLTALMGLLRQGDAWMQRDTRVMAGFAEPIHDNLAALQEVYDLLGSGQWDAAIAALHGTKIQTKAAQALEPADLKFHQPPLLLDDEAEQQYKLLTALLTYCSKAVETLQKNVVFCTEAEFQRDRVETAKRLEALVQAVEIFSEQYLAAKLSENVLDYADFEQIALELLQDEHGAPTPLCQTVRQRYEAILVDEYQDTNALQEAIYFALARAERDNLFFVGDIKQSIYRFRDADPTLFTDRQKDWSASCPEDPTKLGEPVTLALDRNFRSCQEVIEGINYIFERVFSEQLGGVTYGPGQQLVQGVPSKPYRGLCELDVLMKSDTEADAAFVAKRIREMKEQGFLVRGKNGERPCGYEDFCILLRARSGFAVYKEALAAQGIPVYADIEENVLDAPPVRPFAALLCLLDNPAQDVELVSVMLSPMFRYTQDDLVALRDTAKHKGSSLFLALREQCQEERYREFWEQLMLFRDLACSMTVPQLMEELLARTGYLAAVGAMPDGIRGRELLAEFVGWASQAGRAGLGALVRAIQAARQGSGVNRSEESGAKTRPGCVSIMTIHRSKGLEFPIVIVASTSRGFNTADLREEVLKHRKFGLALTMRSKSDPNVRYKSLPYVALAQAIKQENMSEEMRTLYVALTRAQDALIMTVPCKKLLPEEEARQYTGKAEPEPNRPALLALTGYDAALLGECSSMGDWLLAAVMQHPDAKELRARLPWNRTEGAVLDLGADADGPAFRVRLCDPVEAEAASAEEAAAAVEPDAALLAELQQSFAWQSQRAPLSEVPVKVSVTAVTHGQRDVTLEVPIFAQKKGVHGAERGTLIHAFMENVPFDRKPTDLRAEVRRQKEALLLEPALAEQLEKDSMLELIRPFFESKVWERIQKAERVLREEPFITSLPAHSLPGSKLRPGDPGADEPVLVQGIADVVLVYPDSFEILDYKTDKSKDPNYYKENYAGQLRLYAEAFAKRLDQPVKRLTVYSFSMGAEVEIPWAEA